MTWVVAKVNRNQENILKNLCKKSLIMILNYLSKNLRGKTQVCVNLLGEYVFLKIKNNSRISREKYLKGLKYFFKSFSI